MSMRLSITSGTSTCSLRQVFGCCLSWSLLTVYKLCSPLASSTSSWSHGSMNDERARQLIIWLRPPKTECCMLAGTEFTNDQAPTAMHCSSREYDSLIGGHSHVTIGSKVFVLHHFPLMPINLTINDKMESHANVWQCRTFDLPCIYFIYIHQIKSTCIVKWMSMCYINLMLTVDVNLMLIVDVTKTLIFLAYVWWSVDVNCLHNFFAHWAVSKNL